MLGVTRYPGNTPADDVMRGIASRLGVLDTFEHTPVGVWFGSKPGERVPDPYFGGEGPDKVGCTHCGSCMVGCRVGAKNTSGKAVGGSARESVLTLIISNFGNTTDILAATAITLQSIKCNFQAVLWIIRRRCTKNTSRISASAGM